MPDAERGRYLEAARDLYAQAVRSEGHHSLVVSELEVGRCWGAGAGRGALPRRAAGHPPPFLPLLPPSLQPFYNSTSYLDDLTWGAAWLAAATGEQSYVRDAQAYWDRFAGSPQFRSLFLS